VVVWVQLFPDRPHLVLQWHDPETGKRKSQTAGTCNPLEAEKARADLEYELNHGLHQAGARMAWDTFRERFEDEYVAALRANTRGNYADTLNLFERLCNPRRLDLITARTVSAFAAAMRSERVHAGKVGMEPSTVKVRLQFLRTALAWAVAQGLMAKLPTFPRVKLAGKAPQPVAGEAFERLLDKAGGDAEMRAYLLCGWLAGLRLREAYNLEWGPAERAPWVDLERNRLWLPAAAVKATRDQWLPLDPELREALEALPRHGKRVFRFDGPRGRVCAEAVSQRVRALARRAGLRMSMKTLRRGFGCRYAADVPAQVLQKLMRHSNIKTTMDYYANVDAAVEAAVLGRKRNSSRNSCPPAADTSRPANDANHQPGRGLAE
jgi:integrase